MYKFRRHCDLFRSKDYRLSRVSLGYRYAKHDSLSWITQNDNIKRHTKFAKNFGGWSYLPKWVIEESMRVYRSRKTDSSLLRFKNPPVRKQ